MNEMMTAAGGNPVLPLGVMLPFLGGLVVYGIGRKHKKARDYAAILVGFTEFLLFLGLFFEYRNMGRQWFGLPDVCGFGIYFTLDGFRAIYGLTASFMWLVTTVFSEEYLSRYRNRNRYYLFTLFTLGATTGVFLSAELMTTFLFFEIMSFTSYVWVVHDETKEALRAGETYLAIAVIGGLVMLMGLFCLYTSLSAGVSGPLWIDELTMWVLSRSSIFLLWPAGLCLLFGFGAKAGAFPLHIWLPKAHPVAPAPASALLSGMLTKAGIFGIIIVSCQIFWHNRIWGTLILMIGVITMVLGAVLALFSVNIKRTLACSSMSQIGFILVGIGMCGLLGEENVSAVRGTLLHMVNHSLFKLVLFLAAGVIYMNVHRLDLNEIQGFGRNKPLFHLIFLSGALGIGGIPLWSGYISKTLLHESIVEYRNLLETGAGPLFLTAGWMTIVEWIFLISGGLTVAYMTKLYICIFVEKNRDPEKQKAYDALKGNYMSRVNACMLACCGGILTLFGMMPGRFMNFLADMGQGFFACEGTAPPVGYFSVGNLQGALISLVVGTAIYLLVVRICMMGRCGDGSRIYLNRFSEKLDLETICYRPLLLTVLPFVFGVICRIGDCLMDVLVVFLRKTIYRESALPYELTEGTQITHLAGQILDHLIYGWKRLRALGKEKKPSCNRRMEHRLAAIHSAVSEYNTAVSRSMSFGLFLFCVGFLMTVLYLLYYYF